MIGRHGAPYQVKRLPNNSPERRHTRPRPRIQLCRRVMRGDTTDFRLILLHDPPIVLPRRAPRPLDEDDEEEDAHDRAGVVGWGWGGLADVLLRGRWRGWGTTTFVEARVHTRRGTRPLHRGTRPHP